MNEVRASREGPSARLVAEAEQKVVIRDGRGRELVLRRLNALEKLRLFKAAGPKLAENEPWLGMAALACSVAAIDGVPVPLPAGEGQIESLVERLGDDGLEAVARALEVEGGSLATLEKERAGN